MLCLLASRAGKKQRKTNIAINIYRKLGLGQKMDITKALNKVTSLKSFVSLTHVIASRNESIQIPLNISTADALKHIRCFEFEVSVQIYHNNIPQPTCPPTKLY